MTMQEAVRRACDKAQATGAPWVVICRTDHPYVTGDHFYAIDWREKRLWTEGEYLIAAAAPVGDVPAVPA